MGEMVVGREGEALGLASVTDCAPAPPHLLVVMRKGDAALAIHVSSAQMAALYAALPAMLSRTRNAEVAVAAGREPDIPGEWSEE